LYYVSQRNGTYVVAAQPKFELLAHNVFDDDDSRTNASRLLTTVNFCSVPIAISIASANEALKWPPELK